MYELIILSLVNSHPFHGYLIAKIINDIVGPYARVSNGRLYPLLAKLEQDGFIRFAEETAEEQPKSTRPVQSYDITEQGRERLYQLLMDVTSNPGDYQRIFQFKSAMFDHLSFGDRLKLIDHYIIYCRNNIFHIQNEKTDLEVNENIRSPMAPVARIVEMMSHRLKQWQLELDWVTSIREKEMARHNAGTDRPTEIKTLTPGLADRARRDN